MFTMEGGPVRSKEEAAMAITEVLVPLTGTQLVDESEHPLANVLCQQIAQITNMLVLMGAPEEKIGHWLIAMGAMLTHASLKGCDCPKCRAERGESGPQQGRRL